MANSQMRYSPQDEEKLMKYIWSPEISDDPMSFAQFIYPWGRKGTPLERFKGPRGWQAELFTEVRDHIRDNENRMDLGIDPEMFREAISSGRGIGKSASFAMLGHWFQSTRIGSTVIVTANTEGQLKSRTMAELSKWITLAENGHWFDVSALSMRPAEWFRSAVKNDLKIDDKYYYTEAQMWREEVPDAFAGVHNPRGVLVMFDEGSGIPKPIWTVTEGFFIEPEPDRYWLTFSNPRRNTGSFFECFHRDRKYWRTRNIDSRTVEGTDKKVLQNIVDKYGEDSDEARVEVKGQFPRRSDKQLISRESVQKAQQRTVEADAGAPLIVGVDPARFGSDHAVIRFRQGRDARSIPPMKFKEIDNMQLAYRVAEVIDKYNPDAVCIDAGAGAGVIDRLKELRYHVHEVHFGSKATDPRKHANKRTEMWCVMAEWLDEHGCIDEDQRLADDLVGPEYDYAGRDGSQIILESKEHMKSDRGLDSPDDGDALALTFARKVSRRDSRTSRHRRRGAVARGVDCAIFD